MPVYNPPATVDTIPGLQETLDAVEVASLPTGGTTGQALVKVSNADHDVMWDDVAGGPGSADWGDIGGTLSDQTDLQTALDAKAPLADPTFTGTVAGVTKAMVGLGNVDNTSDANKPVSTATQTALDGKQPLDSDLTTIAGLTATTNNFMVANASAWASRTPAQAKTHLSLVKGDVGLGNVDNTADTAKPVSTAQQTALNLKANLSAPEFTSGVGGIGIGTSGLSGNSANALTLASSNTPTTVANCGSIYHANGVLNFMDSAGVNWVISGSATTPFIFEVRLSGTISTGANVTPVDVTNFVFSYVANASYFIEIVGGVTAPAATTGMGLQFNVSTAVSNSYLTFFHQLANTGTLAGGNAIADDASQGVSSGIPANAGVYPFAAFGTIQTSISSGTAQLRLRSETTAVVTLTAGTVMRVRKMNV